MRNLFRPFSTRMANMVHTFKVTLGERSAVLGRVSYSLTTGFDAIVIALQDPPVEVTVILVLTRYL